MVFVLFLKAARKKTRNILKFKRSCSTVADYNTVVIRNVLSQLPSILGASFEKTVEILMATGSRRTHHVLLIAMANACTSTTGK